MLFLRQIETKLNIEPAKIDKFWKGHIEKQQLVSEFILLEFLKISLTDFQKLQNYLKGHSMNEQEINLAKELIDKLNSIAKNMPIVNDSIIKSGAKISREAMNYIIKNKEEEARETTIISINTENREGFKKLTLEELGVKSD